MGAGWGTRWMSSLPGAAALWKINGMVSPPEQVYTDPDVIARTQETLRRHGTAPAVPQPTREQLRTAPTSIE